VSPNLADMPTVPASALEGAGRDAQRHVPDGGGTTEGRTESALSLIQQRFSARSGRAVAAADDVLVVTLWDTFAGPPDCYRNERTTQLWIYDQAEGARWSAFLYYWDAGQQQWRYTGAGIGPIYPVSYYVYINVWEYANGVIAPSAQAWNAGTEGDYYMWAEYAIYSDGSVKWDWMGTHQNVVLDPGNSYTYYDYWCYLPR
jgi:hypothetical protein